MMGSFDLVEAFIQAFQSSFARGFGFLVVSFAGFVVGAVAYDMAALLISLPTTGWAAISWAAVPDGWSLISAWASLYLESLAHWWAWPFLLTELWLAARLRSGDEWFPVFVVLSICQPIHTFAVLMAGSPLTLAETLVAILLLALGCAVLVGGLLTLRHVQESLGSAESTEDDLRL